MRGDNPEAVRDDARATAEAFLHRTTAGMIDDALALLAPNASADLTPLKLRGPASEVIGRYGRDLARAFPELRLRTRRVFVGMDGTVVAEVTMEGVQAAELWGIPSRGRALDLDQVWLLRVDESVRLSRIGAYWCQLLLCRSLGERRLDRVSVGSLG
jgi:SnoaL-like domain